MKKSKLEKVLRTGGLAKSRSGNHKKMTFLAMRKHTHAATVYNIIIQL